VLFSFVDTALLTLEHNNVAFDPVFVQGLICNV